MRVLHLLIYGRVQGVGYRHWMALKADALQLKGFVRNRHDGTVEAVLSGSMEDIDTMLEICRSGPSMARVDDIVTKEITGDYTGFSVLQTR